MSAKQKATMLRTLRFIFIGLMILGVILMVKNLSAYFGITGDGPFIHGWVTMVTEQEPVGTPHPDSTHSATLYHSSHHKLVTIEFADMGLLFKEKYLAYIVFHIAAWLLGLIILYQMYKILSNLEQGMVFQEGNVRRIRFIALSVVSIPSLLFVSNWILAGITYTFHGHQYITDMHDLHRERVVIGALVALLIFAFGEIFRTGIRLKEEHDMVP
ncbi:MAG: hypothetical protein EPGJADBJ_04014 [Saprospiraceae bacterium]|nr:hypothetical protein [Saprospiraceae bacterium]